MKVKVEPTRLKKIIEASMLEGGKTKIYPSVFTVDKGGWISTMTKTNSFATHIIVIPKFFLEYEVKEKDNVVFPQEFLENFKSEFHFINHKELTFSANEKSLTLQSKDTIRNLELTEHDGKDIISDMFKKFTDGYVFETILYDSDPNAGESAKPLKTPATSLVIQADDLKFPYSNVCRFEYDGKSLSVKPKMVGDYKHDIPVEKVVGGAESSILVDGDFIDSVLKHLEGKVLLSFTDWAISFSCKRKDHSISYAIASKEE